jgi:HK97 family phage major capsid protein
MSKILEMKETRANLTNQIRGIIDQFEGKEMDQLKKDELKKLESEFDNLTETIQMNERQLERERTAGEVIKNKMPKDVDDDVYNAFVNAIKSNDKKDLEIYNALQQDNPTQAGALIAPQKFVSELIADLNNILFIRQMCNVLPPLVGAHSLGYPKRTARASTFKWGTELSTPTADTALAFGKREFKPKPGTGEILVSRTLLRHAPNADGIVRSELTYDAGVNLEEAYIKGDGSNKPLGLFTASADGISTTRDVSTGNTATEIKFDGLIEAKYKLKEQYMNNLNWIFHRDAVKQIAKLKDGEGQYIWKDNVRVGEPSILLGVPFRMSEYAPNTFTTSKYVGIIGNLKMGYWIVDSLNMEIQILNELYARSNQVDYIYRLETDGAPVLEEAFARVKLA